MATVDEVTTAVEKLQPHADKLVNGLTLEQRVELAFSAGDYEKCINAEALKNLLDKKPTPPRAYDGFEPSGRMHIAQGIAKAINVNKLTKAGCHYVFWIADWFAQLNNKMGGDLKKIKVVGRYFIEIWKACGMNIDDGQVEFLWASEEINKRPDEYWSLVMDIARRNTLARVLRCTTAMGRKEDETLSAAQIFYPCMQAADIFFLKVDICNLGEDQRKVNMLAIEYCSEIKRKLKPVILSHRMIPGLKEGQEKMSKSDPEGAIFMEDTPAEVKTKIKKAFCPPGVVDGNPCLQYARFIVLPKLEKFEVQRKDDNGGNKTYTTYTELEADYISGALHPGDLKPGLVAGINSVLQPVRDHFENNNEAKELLKKVKAYRVTR